ncbi:MAG: YbgC/FadM family acyl-CoA thioesterase [Succinivibrio sp.]|nr:YbgC/FadM family acyl-CoA thioesterase [Succinivibrio sp.]
MSENSFTWQVRVYFEDTDAGGIVYYANYLKFCERARTEWLRRLNISQQDYLLKQQGFVIVDLSAKYRRSARLDDLLTINCVPVLVRGAKLRLAQQILNEQGELLFDFACSLAYVNFKTGRPQPIPDAILAYAKAQLVKAEASLSSQLEH